MALGFGGCGVVADSSQTQHAIERGPYFVAHVGQEVAFDSRQVLGLMAGRFQFRRAGSDLGFQMFVLVLQGPVGPGGFP